jgi:serine/threonine-protein kinase
VILGIESPAGWERAGAGRDASTSVIIDGRYRLLERIGAGAMGTVYRAKHLVLERALAIKVLRRELASDPEMIRGFQQESQLTARIRSEHIVDVLDAGTLPDGVPYFVMELLAGTDLRRALTRESPFTPLRAAHLGVDVCRGLERAHALGLVHRDLKPENLFLTRGDDGREIVKILDFGVAKSNEDAPTRPGGLIGTVRYMAPEQVGLDLPLGPATDVYALGMILYECLSGEAPFKADTLERLLYRVMTGVPTPLGSVRPELPSALCNVVARAIAREPRERYASAAALRAALAPFTRGGRGLAAGSAPPAGASPSSAPAAHTVAEGSRLPGSQSGGRSRASKKSATLALE